MHWSSGEKCPSNLGHWIQLPCPNGWRSGQNIAVWTWLWGFPPSSKLTPNLFQFDRMQELPENHFWVSGASWVNINNYIRAFSICCLAFGIDPLASLKFQTANIPLSQATPPPAFAFCNFFTNRPSLKCIPYIHSIRSCIELLFIKIVNTI